MSSLNLWFAQEWNLLWLMLVPALAVLGAFLRWRRHRAMRQLTGGHALANLNLPRRRLASLCWLIALVLIVIGSAGPLWGRDPAAPPALGRDVLVVLDVSRSMLAEDQPPWSRLARAKAYVEELADTLQRRGGYRLGLVIFAGKAKVLCPLTEDFIHFRFALEQAHPDRLGPGGRIFYSEEGPGYGTSLSNAIDKALTAHDPRFRGFQELVLISDGDDQIGDWQAATDRARNDGIAVHTLAIGDPSQDWFIPTGRSDEPYLLHLDEATKAFHKVTTRRNDRIPRAIAERTKGEFLPEETSTHPLVQWYQTYIAPLPPREFLDDRRPLYLHRFSWFFAGGLLLLVIEMVLGDAVRQPPVEPAFHLEE